jgi:hypothetical protein
LLFRNIKKKTKEEAVGGEAYLPKRTAPPLVKLAGILILTFLKNLGHVDKHEFPQDP